MKKLLTLLCAVLCILTLSACAAPAQPTPAQPETPAVELNTMGDAIRAGVDGNYYSYSVTENHIQVVTDDYVCEADLTPELYEKLNAIDFFAEDKDEQYAEILNDLPIASKEPRNNSKLTDEQISSLVGKKGQELLDMGYECFGWNLNGENAKFFLQKNGFDYYVTFEEHWDETDDMDTEALIGQSTIKEISDTLE